MRNSKGFQLQPLNSLGSNNIGLPPRSVGPGQPAKAANLGSLPGAQQFDTDRVSQTKIAKIVVLMNFLLFRSSSNSLKMRTYN